MRREARRQRITTIVLTDPIREFIANDDVALGGRVDGLDVRELVATSLAAGEVDADALRRGGVVGHILAGSTVDAVRAGAGKVTAQRLSEARARRRPGR